MGRTMIDLFNSNVSDAINKNGDFYKTWIGQTDFTPNIQILQSSDVNCGAVCNELEFGRSITAYFVQSLNIDNAEDDELEELINAFIDLPRRGNFEDNEIFRNRYKFISIQQSNPKRTTRWAILDALGYFINNVDSVVQIIELFDSVNLYFQVRIEGIQSTDGIIFLNNLTDAWVNQGFVGGPSVGAVITYIGELINRIKAAGVDFDVLFIDQSRFTKNMNAFLGTIQMYKTSISRIKGSISFTKIAGAQIV